MQDNCLGIDVICFPDDSFRDPLTLYLDTAYPLYTRGSKVVRSRRCLVMTDKRGPSGTRSVLHAGLVLSRDMHARLAEITPSLFDLSPHTPQAPPHCSHVLSMGWNESASNIDTAHIWAACQGEPRWKQLTAGGDARVRAYRTENAARYARFAMKCLPGELSEWTPPPLPGRKMASVAVAIVRQNTGATPFPPDLALVLQGAEAEGSNVGIICVRPPGVKSAPLPPAIAERAARGEIFVVECELDDDEEALRITRGIRALAQGDALALLEREIARGIQDHDAGATTAAVAGKREGERKEPIHELDDEEEAERSLFEEMEAVLGRS